jgi:hypothetical protein
MRKLIASVLLACVCVGCGRPVLANPPEAPAEGPAVVDTLKKLELASGDAMVALISTHYAGSAATPQGSLPLTA